MAHTSRDGFLDVDATLTFKQDHGYAAMRDSLANMTSSHVSPALEGYLPQCCVTCMPSLEVVPLDMSCKYRLKAIAFIVYKARHATGKIPKA